MIWDGQCAFCAYWIAHWQEITKDKVNYQAYQQAAEHFPDINKRHFMLASRLIECDGQIYSGPRSAYRTFTYGTKWRFLDRWYETKPWFKSLSNNMYSWVTKNRGKLYKLSKLLFGSNPKNLKPFWAVYLLLFLLFLYYLVVI